MSKYEPLRRYLERRGTESVPMSFAEIEKIIGFKLPVSQKYPAWWSNNPTNNVMTNEWLAAGYKTEQVDIEGRKLIFRRTRPSPGREMASLSSADDEARQPRRHPLFGRMKGMITILPGTDLTEPADPRWADIAWGEEGKVEDRKGGND
jgi:hypothetical protein